MTYKEIFGNIDYPDLLNNIEDLDIVSLPPWDFIKEGYDKWKQDFDKVGLHALIPFARMRNDDVIATFDSSQKIFLFLLPLNNQSHPFKIYENSSEWLKRVLEDVHEYLVNY
jgi:hypothetical protein